MTLINFATRAYIPRARHLLTRTAPACTHQIVLKLLRTESGLHKISVFLQRCAPTHAWIALFWYETQLYKRLQDGESIKMAALEVCAG